MSKLSYTNKQIEAANLLRSVSKMPSEVFDEIVTMVGEAEQKSIAPAIEKEDTEAMIKMRLLTEKDWRTRASLAALIISKSLE